MALFRGGRVSSISVRSAQVRRKIGTRTILIVPVQYGIVYSRRTRFGVTAERNVGGFFLFDSVACSMRLPWLFLALP